MANKFMVGDKVKLKHCIDIETVQSISCDGGLNFEGGTYTLAPEMYELVCNKHGVPGKSIITPTPALISMDKKYVNISGQPVRLLCVDRNGEHYNSVLYLNTRKQLRYADTRGRDRDGDQALVEVKPRIKRTVWVNLAASGPEGTLHKTRASADNYWRIHSGVDRFACVELVIDVEEGTGL